MQEISIEGKTLQFGLKELVTLVVPVLVAISTFYIIGYWSLFEVNALEFVSLADVAKLAIYPLAATAFFGFCFYLLDNTLDRATRKSRPPPRPDSRPMGAVHRNGTILISLVAIAGTYLFLPQPTKWMLIAMASFILMLPLAWEDAVVAAIPDRFLRYLIVISPVPFILFAFYTGRSHAVDVLVGNAPRTVDVARSKLGGISVVHPVAYLGMLGDTHFLYEMKTDLVVLVKNSDANVILFKPRRPSKGIAVDSDRLVQARDEAVTKQRAKPVPIPDDLDEKVDDR